jgi:hypothetical protein
LLSSFTFVVVGVVVVVVVEVLVEVLVVEVVVVETSTCVVDVSDLVTVVSSLDNGATSGVSTSAVATTVTAGVGTATVVVVKGDD